MAAQAPTRYPPRAGDFTGMADDYARYRPGYCPAVIARLLAMVGKPAPRIDAADVGAGTGICARMLARAGVGNIIAVEPNAEMLRQGRAISDSDSDGIDWREGSGEHTSLTDACLDLLCMATSFHWVDFAAGTREAARVLRPGGCFVAMWNPRVLDGDPLMREIEAYLTAARGRATMRAATPSGDDALSVALLACGHFTTVDQVEGEHTVHYTPAQYMGLMRSVNHLRVDLGEVGLGRFLDWLAERTAALETIEARYRTRAWIARIPARAS